jgi:hypothetical protein
LKNFAGSDELRELCKYMELTNLVKDYTLFEQGDSGDNFYIVFSGMVTAFTRTMNQHANTYDYEYLCDLKEGDSFGELSLIYGAPRSATIRTVDLTDLIIITKEVYDRIIKKFQVDQIVYIVDFFSNLVVLQNVPKDVIIGLATKTQVVKVKSHEVFAKEGEETNIVWFIYTGKVNIIKNVPINNKIKPLKIDTLGTTDIFGHHTINTDCLFEYTVITQLPCEFLGITKSDFLGLPQEVKDNIFNYAKPYPETEVIRRDYFNNKRWAQFK